MDVCAGERAAGRRPFPDRRPPPRRSGVADARACFRGQCNRQRPAHLAPGDYREELSGDGDAKFANCAFFETLDSRVDDRLCEQKVATERSEDLAYFTDPPRRVYTQAVMERLSTIDKPHDAQTVADRHVAVARLLTEAAELESGSAR